MLIRKLNRQSHDDTCIQRKEQKFQIRIIKHLIPALRVTNQTGNGKLTKAQKGFAFPPKHRAIIPIDSPKHTNKRIFENKQYVSIKLKLSVINP